MIGVEEDKMWVSWQEAAPCIYDRIYYSGNPLVSKVNNAGHWLLEKSFGSDVHFDRVLEVGAGTGFHLEQVKHTFNEYMMTDISADLLDKARVRHANRKNVGYEIQDATALKYPDNSFDRLISVYNLEHLPQPHRVLREWRRVLKPGGIISISIPLDGGIAWRLGRYLTTRRAFAREGLDLNYIIAREHVNPSYNLISLIRHYFSDVQETYFPLRIPMVDLNLVYSCNIRVK
ncbi:MAG: class I SAM-dependent methyltransferase [Alphaproteobacteria bacterium PRO2]|nr:class I SAM-dependent methyltransferase [Alphaproteobacteria bacterium PRO2]